MSAYSDFNTYCIANFGALAEPLVRATFGNTPAFVVAGDWVYPSRNSASIAFETTLPCKGHVEWGPTTAYGNSTALPDRWYYLHLHYLTGLTPGVTYHYRLVAVDESGATVTSADRTLTTPAMAAAIAIPGGAYPTPYVASTQGATYILTGNVTASTRAISITANDVTIDLNGYTISYDNAPNAVTALETATSSSGIHFFKYNANTQGTLARFLNGTIVQGANNGTGVINVGFNPIAIWEGRVEVAGITASWTGDSVGGILNQWGSLDAHHNCLIDGGTVVDNRSQGIKVIFGERFGPTGCHHNLIRRGRHQCIMSRTLNNNGVFSNEIYADSWKTNAYAIGGNPLIYSNKIFGTGYHSVAVGFLIDAASPPINQYTHDNFIHMQGEAPSTRDLEYGADASVIGVRLSQYYGSTARYDNYIYERNVIVVKGRNGTLSVRGAQLATSAYISGMHFRNNTVKCEIQDSGTKGACIVTQGDTAAGANALALPGYIENNTLISNYTHIRFGDQYECGGMLQFRNNSFTKTGALAGYKPLWFGSGSNNWDSYGSRLVDSVLGSGVVLTAPVLDADRGRRDFSIGHSLYIKALGNADVPLASTTVTLYDSAGLSTTATTDAQGVARVEIIEDFYEALDGAGAMTHTTRSGWNLQTAGYGTRVLTAPELAVSNNPASPLSIRFGAGAPPADVTPPAAVVLSVGSATPTSLTLSWTAPGDDGGTGTATAYEVRRSLSPITGANFAAATLCAGPPTPTAAGSAQQMIITGLLPGYIWYFALRTSDEAGNWSAVSNSPSAQTTPQPSDVTAPAAVTDLAVASLSGPQPDEGDVRFSWTAPGDDLGSGTATSYDIRYKFAPFATTQLAALMTNGSLYTTDTARVTASFIQDIGNASPVWAAPIAIAAPGSIMHFIPPCSAQYAACVSAICGAEYQLTTQGGAGNLWLNPEQNVAAIPDGAFGAPTAAAVIAGTLASRTFARATIYVNLSPTAAVGGAPGGSLPPLGVQIVPGSGYGSSNTAGMLPQRGGIFWGQTTALNLAAIAPWKTWVGNNAQTEGPTDGVNSATPVADWRAARAAAVPTNPTGRFLESHNGLGVFDTNGTGPDVYWPLQRRIYAFCQLDPTNRWIQESGAPLRITFGTPPNTTTIRFMNITDDRLQEFMANEVVASVARCGADGAFGDEWHSIHPNYGVLHLTVPNPTAWTAGMVRMCEVMNTDFASATPMNGTIPAPAVAGTPQHADEIELGTGNRIYVAMTATDEVGNVSLMSNIASMVVPWLDDTAPNAVNNLATVGTTATSVTLQWTAPADYQPTGNVAVTSYDVRYSTASINSGNWASATQATGEPAPAAIGVSQTMPVSPLSPGTLYYFAIKSTDAAGNVSDISNVPSATTVVVADTTPPAAISNLSSAGRTQTTITLSWTAPGDDGGSGVATQYDIRYSLSPIDAGNFLAAVSLSGVPVPAVAGTTQTFQVTGLSAATSYYFAMKTADEALNWSVISNVLNRSTAPLPPDTTPPADTTDLLATPIGLDAVILKWTAPGDDGTVGTVTTYDIRYSTSPITPFSFVNCVPVGSGPAPVGAGLAQSLTVSGLAQRTKYYFALRSGDEAGNYSGLSNVTSVTTSIRGRYRMRVECTNRLRLRVEV